MRRRVSAQLVAVAVFAIGLRIAFTDCVPTPGEEECELSLTDGIDNDCNGLMDASDPGCWPQWARPGDCNADGNLDISDAVCLLGFLFLGNPAALPCGDGTREDPSNLWHLDGNGDGRIDLSDAVHTLSFLFAGGVPHVMGAECVWNPGCPAICAP